jgi:MoaA/NifB/PqqE/SkfB family radical SAM enzyme
VLITEERGKALVDANFNLHASIDAATDRTYKYIRGSSLAPIIRRLEAMSNYSEATNNNSYSLSIVFTPMVINLRELPELIKTAAQIGAKEVHVQNFTASLHYQELDPKNVPLFAEEMYEQAIEMGKNERIKVNVPNSSRVTDKKYKVVFTIQ